MKQESMQKIKLSSLFLIVFYVFLFTDEDTAYTNWGITGANVIVFFVLFYVRPSDILQSIFRSDMSWVYQS